MRSTRIVLATTLVAAFGLLLSPPAQAAPIATPCSIGIPVLGDYDGDGGADQLVGVVGLGDSHDLTRYRLTPSDGGAPTWLYLGGEITSADLNGDICSDAVNEDYPRAQTLLGGPDGLDPTTSRTLTLPQSAELEPGGMERLFVDDAVAIRHNGISQVVVAAHFDNAGPRGNPFLDVFTLDAAGVAGTPRVITLTEVSSTEGVVLAASGGTVAVGLCDLTVAGKTEAGGVLMLTADATDHTTLVRRATLTQNSPRVPGTAETGDGFGWTLDLRDGRLAVGVPLETTGKAKASGAVQPILWHESTATYTAYRQITQSTKGVVGTNETNDWFGHHVLVTRGLTGTGSYDIAIGAREKVGKARDAGSVTVANFTKASYRSYTQNSAGIPGTAEKNDWFGGSLGALRTSTATDTLLIGAQGERKDTLREIGYVIRSNGRKLSSSTKWTNLPAPAASAGIVYENWGTAFAK